MTFEEWYEANQHNIPFDDKEIGLAWELLKYVWGAGYSQCQEDSDPDSPQNNPNDDWWKQP